ncbi:hypothetical protein GUITHDRAFT_152649 [Guillardia theta CCMP2712]|uniref:Uncharacterized protein n=1 Tax=Guillardia theta (strain CCMP2712) TaxID=905079 RepID=L1JBZ2_GUITC|nr:hypothetical protein GUITHDRAFT_152649 [Guillardia theta CCMP2712]EKX45615.1 hypothetical protein GUITHDRAFT_152649 [Guillardia theta CCMP2712]|mmetsp:Transcript_50587/g.158047  ORF Transcript_50587/g.158047 Transcript_50587/m.158047 type:complete len:387 (-) Transcript_50587:727-1887(-)|eukprot:XP_005832595.1 hypothetical protein GUITHDRAFT_152649 [Guillardia theta CCMP2712]
MADDEPPELEDMAEELAMSRRRRQANGVQHGSENKVDRSLYQEVVEGPRESKKILVKGTHVKVAGLQNAKQYNGRMGTVIEYDEGTGKFGVELEKDKRQIKVKPENLEVVESFGGLKGGFLGEEKRSEDVRKHEDDGIEVIKPHPRKEGVLDGLKSLKVENQDVPEWMKANDDLLREVESDTELASAVNNQKLITAIDEISKDPKAWMKYQNDEEVKKYFSKMMGLFGKRYERYEEQASANEKKQESKSKTSVVEELLAQDMKQKAPAAGKSLIQEIEHNNQDTKKKPATKSNPRKGTTDYSKWDEIDSDEEEEAVSGLLFGPKVDKNDARVKDALSDLKVQQVMRMLNSTSDEGVIQQMLQDKDVAEKIQLLMRAGVVDIKPPSK